MFELHIPELASLGPARVAEVVLRHAAVGEQVAAHEVRLPLTVNLVSADEAAAQTPDAEVTEEVIVLKADRGEFEQARELLQEASAELRRIAPASAKADDLLEQAEWLDTNVKSMGPQDYDARARKTMSYQMRQRRQRRKR